jgi:hypothetical protein
LATEALHRVFGARWINLAELMIHADWGSQTTGKKSQQRLDDKKSRAAFLGDVIVGTVLLSVASIRCSKMNLRSRLTTSVI